jgi:hypothetical protein
MSRRKSPGLFNAHWLDMDGKRLGRATRKDYAIAYRLWSEHADIRLGKAKFTPLGGSE